MLRILRRRPQFSLRMLLLLWALPMPIIGWVINVKFTAVRQRAAATKLQMRGFWVGEDEAPPPTWLTNWMRKYVDQDAFDQFSYVTWLREDHVKPEDLSLLRHLPGLRDVRIASTAMSKRRDPNAEIKLTSEDVVRLASISSLAGISIEGTFHPEAALEFTKLPELHTLELPNTPFTDQVLAKLCKKETLSALDFDASDISESGLAQLANAPVFQTLCLRKMRSEPSILGGLLHCEALTGLKIVDSHLRLTDAQLITKLRIQSLIIVDCDIEDGFYANLSQSKTIQRIYTSRGKETQLVLDLKPASLKYCDDRFAKVGMNSSLSLRPTVP